MIEFHGSLIRGRVKCFALFIIYYLRCVCWSSSSCCSWGADTLCIASFLVWFPRPIDEHATTTNSEHMLYEFEQHPEATKNICCGKGKDAVEHGWLTTQSSGALEHTDCISAEGVRSPTNHCIGMTLNNLMEKRSIPSLPGPLRPRVVGLDRVLPLGQIELFNIQTMCKQMT